MGKSYIAKYLFSTVPDSSFLIYVNAMFACLSPSSFSVEWSHSVSSPPAG